jgi:outer membrane receptor protein involved in Fe transport
MGVNGNVNILNGYPYTSSLALGGNYYSFTDELFAGAAPSNMLPNPELTWEKSKQTDVGFESRFLNNRLAFNVDYFYKMTEGLLITANAPVVSGNSQVRQNIGKILNKGFEFELSWRDELGDFNYSVNGNLSTLYNEVVESPYGEGRFSGGGGFISGGTYFETGYSIWYLRVTCLTILMKQTASLSGKLPKSWEPMMAWLL